MKFSLILALFALVSGHTCMAQDVAKPPLTLEVKRHLLDSGSNRTFAGESRSKTYTLRVQITNVSSSTVEGCQLSGEALVKRAGDEREKLVKETITSIKLPAMKPNERFTLDFGKINVRSIKWRNGKDFEESVEEWKIVCLQAGKEIAGSQSSENYKVLSKDAPPADAVEKKKNPENQREKLRRRLIK